MHFCLELYYFSVSITNNRNTQWQFFYLENVHALKSLKFHPWFLFFIAEIIIFYCKRDTYVKTKKCTFFINRTKNERSSLPRNVFWNCTYSVFKKIQRWISNFRPGFQQFFIHYVNRKTTLRVIFLKAKNYLWAERFRRKILQLQSSDSSSGLSKTVKVQILVKSRLECWISLE